MSYTLHDADARLAPFMRAVWVPYWIEPILKLNHISLDTLCDKNALKAQLPAYDVELFLAANTLLSSIVPTYYRDETLRGELLREACDRLSGETTSPTYRIARHDVKTFIIYVDKGFLSTLRGRDGYLGFISECLRLYFSLYSLSEVCATDAFARYIDLLNPHKPFIATI